MNDFPNLILKIAEGALSQANTHLTYLDPGAEHWDFISIVNAGHSAELFIKAAIATVAPEKIFQNPESVVDDNGSFDISKLTTVKPKTIEVSKLPHIYKECFENLPFDEKLYREFLTLRNSVLHLYVDTNQQYSGQAAKLVFKVIDPLIKHHFNMHAVEYIEDPSVGYDYLVQYLINQKLKFSFPANFHITEIDEENLLQESSNRYRNWYLANRPKT